MIDVTVIGFGNVGSALSLLLLNNKSPMRLNVMEPNVQKEGAFLDLSHGMPLYPKKELFVNNDQLFSEANFVFYTAGTPNIHGGSRLSTAKQNIRLTKEIFERVNFINNPYVIVITNPVDIVCHSVCQYSNVPSSHVLGTGTFLDSIRLAFYLSENSNYHADDFEATVLGEHGESQVPIFSMTKLKGNSILENEEFSSNDLALAAKLTKGAAFQIRETQKGTMYGVSKCAEVLLEYLLGEEEHSLTLSMLTNAHYRNLLDLDHDICISMPVTLKNGKIEINNEIELLPKELEAYQKSAAILAEIIE